MTLLTAAACASIVGARSAAAQSVEVPPARDPVILSRESEIAIARSAAPPGIGAAATVLALENGRYVVAAEGTNGVTCYVSRSWPGSIEPHCFDGEGSRTILPIHLRRTELGFAGRSKEQIDREIAEGIRTGRFPLPARPAMSWMLSGAQILYSDEGKRAGAWRPHLMIYWPHWTKEETGMAGAEDGEAFLVDESGAESVLVVLQSAFVAPDLPPEALAAVEAASRAAHTPTE
jgi:hypothetical protein